MKLIFSSPSLDDLIRLLKAWRFWSVGALVGGLIGAGLYYLAPPPYRAHAVALVDFNLEQALPQDTDRQHFYYLERETRKLEEFAYADTVIEEIANLNPDVTADELRSGKLTLGQPAEGGWNFYVDDDDPQRAASIATLWATAFTHQSRLQYDGSSGPESYIEVTMLRSAAAPVERSLSLGLYLFTGAVMFLMIASVVVLFFNQPERFSDVSTHPGTPETQVL